MVLLNLPREVIYNILRFLPIKTLLKVRETCQKLKDATDNILYAQHPYNKSLNLASHNNNPLPKYHTLLQFTKIYLKPFNDKIYSTENGKNYCLAIMLRFYPNHIDIHELLQTNGADLKKAQQIISDHNEVNLAQKFLLIIRTEPNVTIDNDLYFQVLYLLSMGISPNEVIKAHRGSVLLLHLATLYNKLRAVEALLNFGAKVDSTNTINKTALHIACENGNIKIVRLLLEYGANPFTKEQNGISGFQTALEKAKNKNHVEIVQILEKHIEMLENKTILTTYSALPKTDMPTHSNTLKANTAKLKKSRFTQ